MLTIRLSTTVQFGDEMSAQGLSEELLIGRQVAAAATAFIIPVSTSGHVIALSIFVVLTPFDGQAPGMAGEPRDARSSHPGRPLCLDRDWHDVVVDPVRLQRGIGHYAKLLLVPVAMARAFTPRQGQRIFDGMFDGFDVFLFAVLRTSAASVPPPDGRRASQGHRGVQSGCFALCAFALAVKAG
jgi:O-antigen ligase